MKQYFISKLLFAALLSLALVRVRLVQANRLHTVGTVSLLAVTDSSFTYQGQLNYSGSPVNGSCDFQFSLWNSSSGGTQIGSTQTGNNVTVSNGLFTIALNFGSDAFKGSQAHWLEIAVRCPSGSGSFNTLGRQALSAAPFALALPGLWTLPNTTSPNVIGGYEGNTVQNDVVGAVIGGGGQVGHSNYVTDKFGTVGGGLGNIVGNNDSDVNNALYATIGGGWANRAYGNGSTIAGGISNNAVGDYSTILGGYYAYAAHYGELAYATGGFSDGNSIQGEAQTSLYLMYNYTDDANYHELFLDGINKPLFILSNRTVFFDIMLVGRADNGESAAYQFKGLIENVGGTVQIAGTVDVPVIKEDNSSWDSIVDADPGYQSLRIRVKGANAFTRWVAMVRTVEVTNIGQ